jgi:dolichyl-phosphate beta-glucosyltransferase
MRPPSNRPNISVVVPCLNEEGNLRGLVERISAALKETDFEIILVDDGSTDNSILILEQFLKKNKIKNKIIKLKSNLGKGAALKAGVLKCDYAWILTCDLDMSVTLHEIIKWQKKKYINDKCNIYFGSRKHKDSIVNAKIYRVILGNFFRFIVKMLLKIKMYDTQCGYKLYKNKIAKKIFKKLKTNKFEHDLEIILNAKQFNYFIKELPVKWTHKPNSKLNIFTDSSKMLYGIILLSLRKKDYSE